IGVIARRIAAAGEQMPEMRRPVPEADLGRHADLCDKLFLERVDIELAALGTRMQIEVEHRACRVFDGREALVERTRGEELLQKLVGKGIAGAVMPGIAAQRLRHFEPMLEDLRRKLDKVAPHRGAGLRWIAHMRQEAVQPVAEFVEQRMRIVKAEKRRIALRE